MSFSQSIYLVLAVILAAVLIYFAPTIVAAVRRHSSLKAIAVINLVAGWTLAGWFICMFWAWTDFGLGRYVRRRRAEAFRREAGAVTHTHSA